MKSTVLKSTYVMKHVENCVKNHVEIFKGYWKLCWKFQGILKTVLKITRCVENHIKNFQVCWKPCRNHDDVTMTWPFQYILYRTKRVKIKLRLSLKAIGSYGVKCVVWLKSSVLKEKTGLVCWQLLHNLHATDIFWFNLAVNFLHFLSNSVIC